MSLRQASASSFPLFRLGEPPLFPVLNLWVAFILIPSSVSTIARSKDFANSGLKVSRSTMLEINSVPMLYLGNKQLADLFLQQAILTAS